MPSLEAPHSATVREPMTSSVCRFCSAPLSRTVADLGSTPLANSYLTASQLVEMEPFYPLRAMVCERCFLVQLDEYETPDQIFSEYAYFSSYSTTWLEHSKSYAEMATERFGLGPESNVVELASNDGYLLQYFVELGIPVLGIEPAENVAQVARENGVRTMVKFFGRATAREVAAIMRADLVVANNVLAHVPDLNDFVAGMKIDPRPDGRRDGRVPAPDAPDRPQRVRHDLPRALLLLLVPDRDEGVRRSTG